MYFQLLQGIHLDEDGVKYATEVERDAQGNVVNIKQPTIKSKHDLVKMFGATKFRRLADDDPILRAGDEKSSGQSDRMVASPDEPASEVAVAVLEGAKEIAKPIGRDVTKNFMGAKKAGLIIHKKKTDAYMVFSEKDKQPITATGTITKKEVHELVNQFLE